MGNFAGALVNMFLFPSALIMGGAFSISDYFVWNEIPTVLGNMLGGLIFTGATLYSTHARTAPSRRAVSSLDAPLPGIESAEQA